MFNPNFKDRNVQLGQYHIGDRIDGTAVVQWEHYRKGTQYREFKTFESAIKWANKQLGFYWKKG